MKPREVEILIRATTDAPLNVLRDEDGWPATIWLASALPSALLAYPLDIQQITVIKPEKKGAKR